MFDFQNFMALGVTFQINMTVFSLGLFIIFTNYNNQYTEQEDGIYIVHIKYIFKK